MKPTANAIAAIICLYFVALALLYANATPFFEAPDEAAHFLYAHNLLKTGELPTLLDGRDAIFASQSTQRHHPPLYYMASALLIAPTQRSDIDAYLHLNPLGTSGVVSANNQNVYLHNWQAPTGDTATAIWILRVFSIGLATGTLWMIYRIGALAFNAPVGLLALLLAASIPTFVFISASINNDNLVTFFYTAGILWTVGVWQRGRILWRDVALISALLAGVALSKVNGLTLFGLVYGGLILGWLRASPRPSLRGHYGLGRVVLTIIISGVVAALLAGWWYVRNADLYGDPLARGIMRGIWGRGYPPQGWDEIASEAESVWLSFWMVLGQFNIKGPGWFFDVVNVVTGAGVIGVVIYYIRHPRQWHYGLFLLTAVALVIVSLIAANQEIKVSQGRILFPMMGALAPLLAVGLFSLPRRVGTLLILPLVFMTLWGPFTVLERAYARLERVTTLPDQALPVDRAASDGADRVNLRGYELEAQVVQPGDLLRGEVYFSADTVTDVALSVQVVDTISGEVRGGIVTYPGMTFSTQLEPGQLYSTQIQFEIDPSETPIPPRVMVLDFSWPVLAATGIEIVRELDWDGDEGRSLILPGPVIYDPEYVPEPIRTTLDVNFGAGIQLKGYTLATETLSPGEALEVQLNWHGAAPMTQDWTLTVGLLAPDGTVAAQQDRPLPAYPTSRWLAGVTVTETRTLTLPDDAPPGDYVLYFGWYDVATGIRLPVAGGGDNVRDDLYRVPITVQ